MTYMANRAAGQYKAIGVHGGVTDASSHRLIQMLMEGALEKIAQAKGNIKRGEISAKGKNISLAISIIDALRSSLDPEKGGEIAENLEALYDYMTRCLLDANVRSDVAKLKEVTSLLLEIKGAWDAIPEEVKYLPTAQ